jgi:hypothetical protein
MLSYTAHGRADIDCVIWIAMVLVVQYESAYVLLSLKEPIAWQKARTQQREAAQAPVKELEPLAASPTSFKAVT